jgi:hypothetical protein
VPRLATVLTAGYRDNQYAELERGQAQEPAAPI